MEVIRRSRRLPTVLVTALALLSMFLLVHRDSVHAASNLPADKMTYTASSTPVINPNTAQPIMTTQMKTSNVADLVFNVTAECSILSNITNMGTSTSAYSTLIHVWVELDGHPVPVVPTFTTTGASGGGQGADDGKVVFCNREMTRTTTFQSDDEKLSDVEKTETANAFNWAAPNVGNGIHKIVVWADFTNTNSGDAMSHGVISNRSLVVNTTNYLITNPSP
jgi:hypothetical protein